jgi:molybdopterin synthase catalytic subunit
MIESRLVRRVIDPAALLRVVTAPDCGATSLFLGTVRDHDEEKAVHGIEYTAYEKMAGAELRRIVEEAAGLYPGVRLAVEHRLGELAIGDISVAIAVAHAHRTPALDAGRYVIEELKKRVPIWKREAFEDGTREWVDPVRREAEATR